MLLLIKILRVIILTEIVVQDYYKIILFNITLLGDIDILLDIPWLAKYNPEIDWKQDTVVFTRYKYIKKSSGKKKSDL